MPRKPDHESLERPERLYYKSITVPDMAGIVHDLVSHYSCLKGGDTAQRYAAHAQLTAYIISRWVQQRCGSACGAPDVTAVLVLDQQFPQRSIAQWESNLRFLLSKYKRSPK
jgi:hypothetical protein